MILNEEVFRKQVEKAFASGKIKTVTAHHDADGISSAVLLRSAFRFDNIEFPEEFGTASETSNLMVDMNPNPEINYRGFVIDHHPRGLNRNNEAWIGYINTSKPASGLVFDLFKHRIPENKWFVVSIGLTGDGQPEQIPAEVFERFPELVVETGTLYNRYGKWSAGTYPLYLQVSSGINALARIGKVMIAYQILKNAKTPLELLNNKEILDAKEKVDKEITRVLSGNKLYKFGNVYVLFFDSPFNIAGRIGSMLASSYNGTFLIINTNNGKVSIRGVLATIIAKLIPELNADGHLGYYGGKVTGLTQNEILRKLAIKFGEFIKVG